MFSNLNDLAKSNPDLVLGLKPAWMCENYPSWVADNYPAVLQKYWPEWLVVHRPDVTAEYVDLMANSWRPL